MLKEKLKEVEGLADAADRLEVESIMMMMTRMSRPHSRTRTAAAPASIQPLQSTDAQVEVEEREG